MERIATVTRSSTYLLTALAAALFILLCWLFGDGCWPGRSETPSARVCSPLITYLLLGRSSCRHRPGDTGSPPEG